MTKILVTGFTGGVCMVRKIRCKNIKNDLEYLGDIMSHQEGREPTPDVARFKTQIEYKKTLCKILRDEKEKEELDR
ncbi:hypothetical protein BHR79_00465 [Methanohalophilus halophilus]|uniref:Uncharacterized protein n=2 Tax=Methanohalophilus TaxID=2175 RepID=A0A1L3PZP8_9EURY|nr:hypothetical protein BHR79_00465 [Methanohalophilus halophilus]RNI11035.1 hypothetical protein EFE40_02335 [Methanohalophilus halophilus]SDW82942.1 hypothetical protein SAMN04515625_1685 [Methanohalophilus halophilus]